MLPLVIPSAGDCNNGDGSCWLRVADQKHFLREGEVWKFKIQQFITLNVNSYLDCCFIQLIVFDDSFEHEAGYDLPTDTDCVSSNLPCRVVLVTDIWHPDLTDDEVKFIELLEYFLLAAFNSSILGSNFVVRF